MPQKKRGTPAADASKPAVSKKFFNPELWIALLLAACVALIYGQVAGHDFLNYDDPLYVTANAQVREGITMSGIGWAFSSAHDANWIPLTWISHMLDCTLFGVRSGWHHFMNVVLHAANTLLLLILLKRMTGHLWRSAFVAFVFALHPLHIESVAWVAERKDVLSTLFFLLAVWVYLKYVEHPSIPKYAALLALFSCGLMSKPMVVTLPVVLLLLDWWPLGRWRSGRRVILEKAPLFALAAIISAIAILTQQQAGATAELKHVPIDLRLANAIVSYVAYLGAFLWPAGLSVLYPYPAQIPAWQWMGAAVALLALTYFAIRSHKPYVVVGWLWYLATLLPVIGLIQVGSQARADRYTYIPLIGIAIVIAWGATELVERLGLRKTTLAACAMAVCAALAATTWWNLQNWQNSVTLFQHAIASTKDNFVAENDLGDALRSAGQNEEAVSHFEAAYRIQPGDEKTIDNLGAALQSAGRVDEAIPILMKAVQLHPASYQAHVDLAHALTRAGKLPEATTEYQRALQIQPGGAEANYGLGGVLASEGRGSEARPHLEAGIQFLTEQVRARPDDPDGRYNLGTLYGFLGRNGDSIRELNEAVRIAPSDSRVRHNLALALAATGHKSEAAEQFGAAVRMNPDDLDARLNLGRTLTDLGKFKEAIEAYEALLRLDPGAQTARQELQLLRQSKAGK